VNGLLCADVPLRNYSLAQSPRTARPWLTDVDDGGWNETTVTRNSSVNRQHLPVWYSSCWTANHVSTAQPQSRYPVANLHVTGNCQ